MTSVQQRRPGATRRKPYGCFELSRIPEKIGSVLLWRLHFDLSVEPDAISASLLSDEERARARIFRQRADRVRFVAGRATLRVLLAERLGGRPRDVRLVLGHHGKPRVLGVSSLDFNLSHSHHVGLFALTEHGQVGVDVERIESSDVASLLAPHILHEKERSELGGEASERFSEAVFRRWVLKEAALKASGVGLSVAPSALRITEHAESRFDLSGGPFPLPGNQARVDLLSTPSGYVGALVHLQPEAS